MATETFSLEVALTSGERLPFFYQADATIGDMLAAIGYGGQEWNGILIWDEKTFISNSVHIRNAQFVVGQTVVPCPSSEATARHLTLVNRGETYRIVHLNGRQLGFGWSLGMNEGLSLEFDGEYWLAGGDPASPISISCSDDGIITLRNGADQTYRTVQEGTVFVVQADDLDHTFSIMSSEDHESSRSHDGRISYRVGSGDHSRVDAPRSAVRVARHPEVEPQAFPLVEIVLQTAPILVMAILMITFTGSPFAFASLLLVFGLPAMQVLRHNRQVKQLGKRLDDWALDAERAAGTVRGYAQLEADRVAARNPAISTLAKSAATRTGLLWNRNADSVDHLCVTIGRGQFITKHRVEYDVVKDVDRSWDAFFEASRRVPDVPFEISLSRQSLGVCGPDQATTALVENVLMSLVLTHGPSAVSLIAFMPRKSTVIDWLADCPQSASTSSGWSGPAVVRGRRESSEALDRNQSFASTLKDEKRFVVAVVHESSGVSASSLREMSEESDGQLVIIWIASTVESLPGFIPARVELDEEEGVLSTTGMSFIPHPRIDRQLLRDAIHSIRPLRDDSSIEDQTGLPEKVDIGQLVDLDKIWLLNSSESLVVGNSVNSRGVVEIDIASEGPHLLAAGMTGSGKSEYVRSMVLSLATRYSPKELAFLLVDYKAGASLGQLQGLPHTVGMVTSLGERDVIRLVKYLNRELVRRQELLAQFEGEYSRYRASATGNYLPRLMIVIDEFQGFVQSKTSGTRSVDKAEAILNVAARGRSAGIHLLIATQNPSSDVVSPAVMANIGLTMALRTADERGSVNLIGVPLALRIPQTARGRLYVRSDGTELQLVQSAFTQGTFLSTAGAGNPVRLDVPGPASRTDRQQTDALRIIHRLSDSWKQNNGTV